MDLWFRSAPSFVMRYYTSAKTTTIIYGLNQMKNSITVTIPFSFKGVEHQPAAVVDLDSYTRTQLKLDQFFHLVATENGIDRYSYEYEVLESSTLIFSQATGLAKEFFSGNSFDFEGFSNKLAEENILEILRKIASETLGIENFVENTELKQALLQAYHSGFSASLVKPE